jgi:hypothetical protein
MSLTFSDPGAVPFVYRYVTLALCLLCTGMWPWRCAFCVPVRDVIPQARFPNDKAKSNVRPKTELLFSSGYEQIHRTFRTNMTVVRGALTGADFISTQKKKKTNSKTKYPDQIRIERLVWLRVLAVVESWLHYFRHRYYQSSLGRKSNTPNNVP